MGPWAGGVFVAVVLSRLLVPLAIPRFPLPGLLGSLVLDAVDQTVFQALGTLPEDYQRYDKALDVYYLVVAYAATMRNWRDPVAFGVARFLWYYRLAGVVAFELTGARTLLVVFPNTFEYFVIAYETVRVRWDPRRLGARAVVGTAAGIWVLVKLPQEWWIHVARLDLTDEVARRPWVVVAAAAVVAGAVAAAARSGVRLPPGDWPPTVDVDAHKPARDVAGPAPAAVLSVPFWTSVLEKAVLLSMVCVVFATVLDVTATGTQLVLSVSTFVVLNAAASQWFARRGTRWTTTTAQFAATLAVNLGIVGVLTLLSDRTDERVDVVNLVFFLLLVSLLTTLYDRYRTMRERRLRLGAAAEAPVNRSATSRPD